MVAALSACAPATDWREMKPSGLSVAVIMPCRPTSHARRLAIAGQVVDMTVYACAEDDMTFSVGGFDVGDPSRVDAMLDALAQADRGKVPGQVGRGVPAAVPGMTPYPSARRQVIDGRRPDGRAIRLHSMVFAYGTRVHQAMVLGGDVKDDVAERFLAGIRVVP